MREITNKESKERYVREIFVFTTLRMQEISEKAEISKHLHFLTSLGIYGYCESRLTRNTTRK